MAKTIHELAEALAKIPNRNLKVNDALYLMATHPTLPVIAMVDSEVVDSESCCWWFGSVDSAVIDDVCVTVNKYNEPVTFRLSCDDIDSIFEQMWDYEDVGIDLDAMPEDMVDEYVAEKVRNELNWKKCICIEVIPPTKEPFVSVEYYG